MKALAWLSLLFLPLPGFGQTLTVNWSKIAAGGGTSSDGVSFISGTAGQAEAGPMSDGSLIVSGGFWHRGAPGFSLEPANQCAGAGYKVSFSAAAAGSLAEGYQWQHDGTNIMGATNSTLTLPAVQVTDGGSYDLVATSPYGAATSSVASLTVLPYTWTTLAASTPTLTLTPSAVAEDPAGNIYVADSGGVIWRITAGEGGTPVAFAGLQGRPGTNDGVGGDARFNGPQGLAVDRGGNLYVADTGNNTIRKITPAGAVSTLAGLGGIAGYVDATGSAARFNTPLGLAVDSSTNVYVADRLNGRIAKITPAGAVSTVVNGLGGGWDGGGPGGPAGVAVDGAGNLYVADTGDQVILVVSPSGFVSRLAGQFQRGGDADDTLAAAGFDNPEGIAVDGAGNLYVTDTRAGTIREVTSGRVATIGGSAGAYAYNWSDGMGQAALFPGPTCVTLDNTGNLLVADGRTIRWGTLGTPAGPPQITSQPVSQTGTATYSSITFGVGVYGATPFAYQWNFNGAPLPGATGSSLSLGTVQLANAGSYSVVISNVAGVATSTTATLSVSQAYTWTTLASGISPAAVAEDPAGNLFVADNNSVIWKISAGWDGVNVPFAGLPGVRGTNDGVGGDARFNQPQGIAVDRAGNVYVSDTGNNTIRKITPAGLVTTLAGLPGPGGDKDGTGSAARFNTPLGLALDGETNLYVADRLNGRVARITPAGVVTTLASSFAGGWDGGGPGGPAGVAVDATGNVYVADTGDQVVQVIAPSGAVSLLAGLFGSGGYADGVGQYAQFDNPEGIAVDATGNVFVADGRDRTIRKITPDRTVSTIGGAAGAYVYSWNDGIGSAALFPGPTCVTIDNQGNLLVADGRTIRWGTLGTPSGPPQITSQPASQTGTATYGKITLGVGVYGGSPFGYQWYFNGAPLAGATSSILIIGGLVQTTNAGSYTVVVSNVTGVATSAAATLSVNPAYTWTTLASGISPTAVAEDPAGNLFVADNNSVIWKISAGWGGANVPFAGLPGVRGTNDGVGGDARFNQPQGIAVDRAGNLYVSDTGNNTIRKITPAGLVTTLAGLAQQAGEMDGTGSAARFNTPMGLALDGQTNLYVADRLNGRVARVTPAGVTTTIGSSFGGSGPGGVAVDAAGNVYVADTGDQVVQVIATSGAISVLAGQPGGEGYADGVGEYAQFDNPEGIAVDAAGNVYVTDPRDGTIRKITPDRTVSTIGGSPYAYVYSWADGIGSAALFPGPTCVTIDNQGNPLVADGRTIRWGTQGPPSGSPQIACQPASQTGAATYSTVTFGVGVYGAAPLSYQWSLDGQPITGATASSYSISPTQPANAGNYTVVVTNAAGSATSTPATLAVTAPYYWSTLINGISPLTAAADRAGNLYYADTQNAIWKLAIGSGQPPTLVAGSPGTHGAADGQGTTARFNQPQGITTDGAGNLYVADTGNNTIRMITPGGWVSTLAGVAGSTGSGDGAGSVPRFNTPNGVAADASGNVYVADSQNYRVAKVAPDGSVSTFACCFQPSYGSGPGVAVDASGNVYVADTGDQAIQVIAPNGVVSLFAGPSTRSAGNADGVGQYANFDNPLGIAVDGSGNVFVADNRDSTVRLITPGRVVATIGGQAYNGFSGDGAGSGAGFRNPQGVAVDSHGTVYVADVNHGAIRVGSTSPLYWLAQPPSQWVAVAGDDLSFTVSAAGLNPISYQWTRNGVNLPSARAATLALPGVAASQAGTYTVTATGPYGPVVSTPMTLIVQSTTAATLAPPTAIPANSGSGTSASIQFGVQAVSDATYEVQVSPDLRNWTTIGTYTAPFTFSASILAGYAGQFYRVVFLHR